MRCQVAAKSGRGGVRTTDLDVAASRVAQWVHALSLFPVTVAVT